MTNTAINNKKYGFNAEAELLQYLRGFGYKAERLHLVGTEDEGDLFVPYSNLDQGGDEYYLDVLIQVKTFSIRSAKGEERPFSPTKLKNWLRDLDAQRAHYAAHRGLSELPDGVLVVKPKNWSWDDALVIRRLKDWVE